MVYGHARGVRIADYEQHGWRHHPTKGSDPVTELESYITEVAGAAETAGLPVCYVTAAYFTLAADAAWHKPEWDTFTTNNAAVFEQSVSAPEDIHFASGHYIVGYEIFSASPPTDPDYLEATVSIFGMESFPTPGYPFIGGFSQINDTTMELADLGYSRWQDYQVFPPATDSLTGDGFFHLLLTKASGSSVDLDFIRMFIVRLAGDSDTNPSTSTFGLPWISVQTTSTLSDNAYTSVIDWSDGSGRASNDGVIDDFFGPTPYTNEWFTVDWGGDPDIPVAILHPGLYQYLYTITHDPFGLTPTTFHLIGHSFTATDGDWLRLAGFREVWQQFIPSALDGGDAALPATIQTDDYVIALETPLKWQTQAAYYADGVGSASVLTTVVLVRLGSGA